MAHTQAWKLTPTISLLVKNHCTDEAIDLHEATSFPIPEKALHQRGVDLIGAFPRSCPGICIFGSIATMPSWNATRMTGMVLSSAYSIGKSLLTPCHIAAAYGQLELLKGVIIGNPGLNFGRSRVANVSTSNGIRPIHLAIASEKPQPDICDMLKFLIDNGAEVNASIPETLNTPLHIAAKLGKIQVYRYLEERGADKFTQNRSKQTAENILARHIYATPAIATPVEHTGHGIQRRRRTLSTISQST